MSCTKQLTIDQETDPCSGVHGELQPDEAFRVYMTYLGAPATDFAPHPPGSLLGTDLWALFLSYGLDPTLTTYVNTPLLSYFTRLTGKLVADIPNCRYEGYNWSNPPTLTLRLVPEVGGFRLTMNNFLTLVATKLGSAAEGTYNVIPGGTLAYPYPTIVLTRTVP